MKSLLLLLLVGNLAFAKTAPNFRGELLGGGRTSLEESLKEGRALLVCFWASWCVPCIEELKTVSAKLKANPEIPLDVLAINVDTSETFAEVKPVLKRNDFKFPVLLDQTHEIFAKYQPSKVLPFSALLSSKGEIASTFEGYHEEMFQVVQRLIAQKELHVP